MSVKLLVVEDDKNLNLMLQLILNRRKLNWEFRSARDGVEALEVLEKYPADLAMVDLEMPRMGGLELIRNIKARPEWARLKLAVLSSSDDQNLKEQVRAAGVTDIWMKPIFPEVLFSRITGVLG
jgi:CheY-like chemotaxis protein